MFVKIEERDGCGYRESLQEAKPLQPWQEALLRGANLIRAHGHHKGDYGNAKIGYCFAGSVHAAGLGDDASTEAQCRIYKAVMDAHPRGWLFWNDAPETTAEEVISTMRRVALGG